MIRNEVKLMALIPSKAKTNNIEENGIGFEGLLIIFAIVLIGQKVFENKVHSWLSWLLLVVVAIVVAYLIFPATKNYGRAGYCRIVSFIKFKSQKYKVKRKLMK